MFLTLGTFPSDLQRRFLSAVERMAGLTAADLVAGGGPLLTSSPIKYLTRLTRAVEVLAARVSGSGTLTAGVLTIANSAVTANTRVFTQRSSDNSSATVGVEYSVAVTPGTGFVITARKSDKTTETADVSTLFYFLVEMASTVATPAASVGTGTYANNQTVTLTSATPGATILYTTDGSAPSATNGKIYGVPIVIDTTATVLRAIAVRAGMLDSAIMASQTYTLTATAPTATPAAGTYSGTQSVVLASATTGAAIRYTVDGSTPTHLVGTVYTGPVSVAVSTTIKAIAFKTGYNNSTVLSAGFAIS